MHSHANPYWTTELYGKTILGLTESDVCFSAAKLFFAYGLGNALTFPLAVGATALLMAERPTPEAVFKRWLGGVGGVKPTVFYGAPTGFAGMLASNLLPKREDVSIRLVSSAGEALPADIGERFKRHFGVDIVDGIGSTEMLHIFISNRPDKVRYGTTGWPVAGYDIELRGEDGRSVCRWRAGRPLHSRAIGGADVLGQSRQDVRDFRRPLDQERRQIHPQFRRRVHLRRPLGRHAEGRRRVGQPLRGRGDAGAAPLCPRSRGDRRARRRRPDQVQGLRGLEGGGEDGRSVSDGEPGDLYIYGPSAALMYWGNRAKTRETFEGRWTRSGDKYTRNSDGTYTYAGRSDDMLKVGGVWVSPFEVEATLVQHPSVLEAAVIGAPDADGLIKSKAFVVLKDGASADEAELKGFVKDRLAPYKYPRSIAFIAELPKTATGKIQRFRLREQEQAMER